MDKYYEIEDTNNPGSFYGVSDGTCEYVNPVYHFAQSFINTRLRVTIALMNQERAVSSLVEAVLKRQFLDEWQEYKKTVLNHSVPQEFFQLFDVHKKKAQAKLLAQSTLTLEDFQAFIFQSWEDYGFKFSKYVFKHNPIEFKGNEHPTVIHKKNDNEIITVGSTDLSDAQLKSIIDKRNIIVANFFDKEDQWHCLFLTYKSISGQELDHINAPHMHYISNSFGISRSDVIANFKRTRYSLDSIHIPFTGYNPMTDNTI